jgi:hypothetical protein
MALAATVVTVSGFIRGFCRVSSCHTTVIGVRLICILKQYRSRRGVVEALKLSVPRPSTEEHLGPTGLMGALRFYVVAARVSFLASRAVPFGCQRRRMIPRGCVSGGAERGFSACALLAGTAQRIAPH